ncbi:MAG TPA: hypothetical protein VKY41_08070 [Xanthomarina sp.]|nr:hypothetical protein [Xanthomarina sp.]
MKQLAAIPTIIIMLDAAFVVHHNNPFARKEKTLLYIISFLVILLTGLGNYSLDTKKYL